MYLFLLPLRPLHLLIQTFSLPYLLLKLLAATFVDTSK